MTKCQWNYCKLSKSAAPSNHIHSSLLFWRVRRNDTQDIDIQHNDILHNDVLDNNTQQHNNNKMLHSVKTLDSCVGCSLLIVTIRSSILSTVRLSVILLSVVARKSTASKNNYKPPTFLTQINSN
jgi:hypothetical protein